jgi:hypothetical protein
MRHWSAVELFWLPQSERFPSSTEASLVRLRYNDLVATAVILQNAVDMTRIIGELERCRLSLFTTMRVLILKDFHRWEPSKFCFIDNSFSVIMAAREPHFLC